MNESHVNVKLSWVILASGLSKELKMAFS